MQGRVHVHVYKIFDTIIAMNFVVVQSLISTAAVVHWNHVLWNKSHVTLHPENLGKDTNRLRCMEYRVHWL